MQPSSTDPYKLVCLLGRQPELSMVELEQIYGSELLQRFSDDVAIVEGVHRFDIQQLGGIVKAGLIIAEIDVTDWLNVSKQLVNHYQQKLKGFDGKLTFGISVYGRQVAPRDIQKTGLTLKKILKKQGTSVRLIPNDSAALSTATSHHNKLGLSENKREICVFYGKNSVLIAESVGTQNITALAARDQGRPKRDAFVGMLPPKLALMMINMSGVSRQLSPTQLRILDPFCGTGVILQEAALLGFNVYGTDLSEKMVDYSSLNMKWLNTKYNLDSSAIVEVGDAIEHRWQPPIDAVVSETYLGQPFSAPPAADKLDKVVRITNEIVNKFLLNLASQIQSGTPLCIAIPAWQDASGNFTQLPLLNILNELGYTWQNLQHVDVKNLAYYREDQIVARQLLILRRQ